MPHASRPAIALPELAVQHSAFAEEQRVAGGRRFATQLAYWKTS
jgi:hypothetical protein